MEIWQMRNYIAAEYNSVSWKDKVQKMSENQVMGVYYSFLRRKEKRKHEGTKPLFDAKTNVSKPVNENKQMNMFDPNYKPETKGSFSFDDKKDKEIKIKDCHQIDMWEYLKSLETDA